MENQTIYFCQGCSAVLYHRVKYCPHCGAPQYYDYTCGYCGTEVTEFDDDCPECGDPVYSDEFLPRGCPWCGNDLDIDGRDLDKRYCNADDCGKEIGGLIRYSDETGEELTVDEILARNDYRKELKDWLVSVYNNIHDTDYSCFKRFLYIYDKKNEYTGKDFIKDFEKMFIDQYMHNIKFDALSNKRNLDILLDKEKHPPKNDQHCFCVIDTNFYNETTDSHTIIKEYVYDCIPGMTSHYYYTVKKLNVTFIFVSGKIPEETNIYSMYDKRILIVTPEKLRSVNVYKLWKKVKEEHDGT